MNKVPFLVKGILLVYQPEVESTVRYLKEFEKDNIILLDGRGILIRDQERLNNIAETG